MSVGKAIYDHLSADVEVKAIFGDPIRVAESRIRTGVSAPFAVFDLLEQTSHVHSQDDTDLPDEFLAIDRSGFVEVEFTVHSKTPSTALAKEQAQTIYTAMLKMRGVIGDRRYSGVRLESIEPPEWNSQVDRFETDFNMTVFVARDRT